MNRRLNSVFLCLLVLGMGFLASAESKTFTWTATLTIPAVLDVVSSETNLFVELMPGGTTPTTVTLSVGTNNGPLELCLGLLPAQGTDLAFTFMYQFYIKAEAPPSLWVEIPTFMLAFSLHQRTYQDVRYPNTCNSEIEEQN